MMRTAVGSFTGNGDQQFINLGFEPDVVITRTSSASYASGYWSRLSFVNRSHSLSNILGFPGGALAVENGFWVGNSNLFNEAGQTMYYIAFADAGENAFEQQDWMGDGFARNIALKNNKTPLAVIIKRDNARPAIFKSTLNALFTPMDGTATPTPSSSTLITAINQGSISLDGANEVNELFGSLGEGINGAFFFGGVNSTVINWTGDGLAGRVIQCGMATSGALIVRDGAASSPRIVTTAMAAGVNAPTKASALQSNEITVSGSTLVIGSTPGTLNNSGSSYTAIIFGTDTGTYARTPAVITRSKKVVSLPGRNIASYIDCGTSDATLKVTGAFSIEWMGSLKYQDQNAAAVGVDQMMLCRSIGIAENSGTPGAITTAGNFSYGLGSIRLDDSAAGYSNGMIVVQSNYLDIRQNITDAATCTWRTGIAPPFGNKFAHWMLTWDGSQFWKLYLNGRLIKQRQYSMVSKSLVNAVGGTAHKTVIGGRWNGSAVISPTRCEFMLARVYAEAVSAANVLTRYNKAALGSATDYTTNLAEEWDATNARGSSLPATVNSANNGTIVGGALIVL